MWNLFLKGMTTLFCLFTFSASFSQTYEYPWAVSLGSSMITYQSHPSNTKISPLAYAPTLELGASKYMNGALDFRTHISLSHKVNFPNAEGSFNSHLIDMSYQLAFKFNNGVFLKRNGFLGPYLLFGVGGSYVQNNPDAYIPWGGGVRFRLNNRFSIRAETVQKISLNKDYQSLAHTIAFVYNLNTKELSKELESEEIDQQMIAEAMTAKDSDLDGIIDIKDECPDIPGSNGKGCPEEEEKIEKSDIAIAQVEKADSIIIDPIPQEKEEKTIIASTESPEIDIPVEETPVYSSDEANTFGRQNRTSLMALVPSNSLIAENKPEKEPVLQNATTFDEEDLEDDFLFENNTSSDDDFYESELIAENDEGGLFLEEESKEEFPEEVIEEKVEEIIPAPEKEVIATVTQPSQPTSSDLTRKNPCGTLTLAEAKSDPILFETGSDQLPEEARLILDGIATKMKSCSYTELVLEGHADARGADKKNLMLSIMRAYNVKYYLVSQHGISQRRITSKGFGEQQPLADNSTTKGQNLNRRVDFQLVF